MPREFRDRQGDLWRVEEGDVKIFTEEGDIPEPGPTIREVRFKEQEGQRDVLGQIKTPLEAAEERELQQALDIALRRQEEGG